MDDDLVLNIAEDTGPSLKGNAKKGGRWTDRLKAKRVAKRKSRPEDTSHQAGPSSLEQPPAKRKRVESRTDAPSTNRTTPSTSSRPHAQIISSLFSYNPKVEAPARLPIAKSSSKPSNAPLNDSSSFTGLGVDPLIVSHLSSKMNISKPTAIQRSVLPAVLGNAESQRDIFIQSQTGSGKTLSFLLPIIQDLLPLSTLSYIDRSIGTLAIIIAPTRELAKQISDVLEALLKMRLRPEDDSAEDPNSARFTRWLVSGLLTGGATRQHEKARLRKGLPIIVSTPGRLLDHLQHSSSFNVGKCRWLVLDEADRLMELGFEETITGIIQGLDGRRNLAIQAAKEGAGHEVGGWDWERRRRTVLCSATIKEDVQKLAGVALENPLLVKAVGGDDSSKADDSSVPEGFTPPSQLSQRYVVAPLKQRLVVLVALLRNLVSSSRDRKGTKIIVFLSCTDSVDYHWRLLGGSKMNDNSSESPQDSDSDADSDNEDAKSAESDVVVESPLLPDTSIIRLHGSLSTPLRLQCLREFSSSKQAGRSSILLCTSVASRGLDLPQVRAVIQYDLPTEGGATEYVHRVGRTARAGNGGEAWSIVAPNEAEWVKWVEDQMHPEKEGATVPRLQGVSTETVLQSGFGGKGSEYEARATDVQLSFERWVLTSKQNSADAQKAFLSHMRAYATHPSSEKHIFHVRHLHIGHLAKAFALRDAPKAISSSGSKSKKTQASKQVSSKKSAHDPVLNRNTDTETRMQEIVRSQGRLSKKKGVMMSSGASEFQIAGGYDLEKLVNTGL
ncbi:DEAD-domain-containing protein [Hymenopellis radicata]|nr:DEAD-domain-containing protein [Hymenopellis radicata]